MSVSNSKTKPQYNTKNELCHKSWVFTILTPPTLQGSKSPFEKMIFVAELISVDRAHLSEICCAKYTAYTKKVLWLFLYEMNWHFCVLEFAYTNSISLLLCTESLFILLGENLLILASGDLSKLLLVPN